MWANNAGTHDENSGISLQLSTTKTWTKILYDGASNTVAPDSGKISLEISATPIFLFSSEIVSIPIGFAPTSGNSPSNNNNSPSGNSPKGGNLNSMAVGESYMMFIDLKSKWMLIMKLFKQVNFPSFSWDLF